MAVFKPWEPWQWLQSKYQEAPFPLNWLLPDPYDPTSYILPVTGLIKKVPSKIIGKRAIDTAIKRFGEESQIFRETHGKPFNEKGLLRTVEKWIQKLPDSPEKGKVTQYLNEYYSGSEYPEVSLEVAAEWVHEALRKIKHGEGWRPK